MARVGTCKDCGARFKVPEATTASQAKCSKCGGVVQIPPAETPTTPAAAVPASAAASVPSAPPASAPAASASASSAAPPSAAAAHAAAASTSRTFPPKGSVAGSASRTAPAAATAAPAKSAIGKPASASAPSATKGPAAPAVGRTAKASTVGTGVSSRKVALGGKSARTGATAGAREAGKEAGSRAGRSRPAARGGAEGDAKKKLPLIPIIAGAVVVLGVAGWFIFSGGSKPVVVKAPAVHAPEGDTDAPASTSTAATDSASAPAPLTVDAAPKEMETPALTSDPAMNLPDEAVAPAPDLPDPSATKERRDPILAFEKLPPMPGTEEQFEEWSGWVHTYFIEAPPPREGKAIKLEIDKLDPIDAAPAFINALIGLDMSDEIQVRDAFVLIDYWQDREGRKMHFNFLDASRMSEDDIDKRDEVAEGWAELWRKKMADPEKIATFRLEVEEALREAKSKEGG